jgi:sugar (pentulose or hexulose) kinase
MPVALSLDLGTTSIAAVAVDHLGKLVARATVANSSSVNGLPAGHAEQDPVQLRALAFQCLRELAAQLPTPPVCLGITGQMHGGLLVDARRKPLTNLVTWQDRRANSSVSDGKSFLESLLSRCDESALLRTGCRISPGYLAATLSGWIEQQCLPSDSRWALCVADWISAELREADPITDRSNAASTGVYDLERDEWSTALIAAARFPAALLPAVRESGAALGGLSPAAAAATGLPAGLPVCNSVGDNQAAVLGSVPVGEPAIQINIGTGGQINWPIERFLRVDGMDTRYLPFGRYMLVGAGLAGGDAYAWVNRTAADWFRAFGQEISSEEIYRRMNVLAAQVPADCDGLRCEPTFRGTRRQPLLRGTFSGITNENFTLGHISRAVLQGIADGMHWFYEHAGTHRPESLDRIVGSGNGLRTNPLLVDAIRRSFGREVWLPTHHEEAAYGAALLAGSTTGLWPDLQSAGKHIRVERA